MSDLPVLDCSGCGVCCLHMGYPAFNLTADQLTNPADHSAADLSTGAQADLKRWLAMPPGLREPLLEQMRRYTPPPRGELDGPCSWLDKETRLCRHHQHRPQVCRSFPVGGDGCLAWRAAYDK
ncbi:MAG: YkgJ family cysteine cluster protein [Planctomycetales bacterium]|nr:YkgJ family cysteine cluster protein [Planctomycetales bacterium]